MSPYTGLSSKRLKRRVFCKTAVRRIGTIVVRGCDGGMDPLGI